MTQNEKRIMLRAILTNLCINEEMFTSVEVANGVKRLGFWMRNREVAEYMRINIVDIAKEYGVEYKTSHIHVDSFGVDGKYYNCALCYHPILSDYRHYQSRDLKAITPDEFEAMHGVSPFGEDTVSGSPDIKVDKEEIVFHFPSN